jgi:hypothetical protein
MHVRTLATNWTVSVITKRSCICRPANQYGCRDLNSHILLLVVCGMHTCRRVYTPGADVPTTVGTARPFSVLVSPRLLDRLVASPPTTPCTQIATARSEILALDHGVGPLIF